MRKPLLSLVAVALVATACSSGSSSSGGYVRPPDPPQHHQPTSPPRAPEPAQTPYDDVTFQDPGSNPTTDPDEDQVSTFAMDVDTASYTIAQRFVADGNLPDPASVRVEEWVNSFDQDYPAPEEGTFAVHIDGAPTPFLEPARGPAPGRHQGPRLVRSDAPGRRPHVRHRHLGVDGPGGSPRAGQGFAAEARPRPRPRRFDRGRHVR